MWDTSCVDWEARILSGRSLVPDLPLFQDEADRALRIFKRLRLPDVIGTPTMAEACGEWFYPIVAALFGSYNPVTNERMIQEFFQVIPKGNAKTSNGGAIMVVALIMNRRPQAEFLFVAPTIEVAGYAFKQAEKTILLDSELTKLFRIQRHLRTMTHMRTGATLQIKAADTDVITGGKQVGTMIDETHVFAKHNDAEAVFLELRGALGKRPDGFLFQVTTQSKDPPAGVFKRELAVARDVRDGRVKLPLLPIVYELPQRLTADMKWKDPAIWSLVNPNLGRSVRRDFLERELMKAESAGPAELARFASQYVNVEIGGANASDAWRGAEFWDRNGDKGLTLDEVISRSEIAVVGIDGGGLDDLLGLAVLGRDRDTRDWLHWGHCWAHSIVLERRKSIVSELRDFEAAGDLTIVENVGDDVQAVADIVERIEGEGLLPEKVAIGVDQAGITEIVDAITQRGIALERIVGIPQGWKLNNAILTTERRLAGGTFKHGASAMMAWQARNAKIEMKGSARTITKQASGTAKIDALLAIYDAVHVMGHNPESGRSFWDTPDPYVPFGNGPDAVAA